MEDLSKGDVLRLLVENITKCVQAVSKITGAWFSVYTCTEDGSTTCSIGDYNYLLSENEEPVWNYHPLGDDESGRTSEWEYFVNPERIENFTEPPKRESPASIGKGDAGEEK